MSKHSDLEAAEKTLRNAQIDVHIIVSRIEVLENEIAILALEESKTIENINILKQNKIVALALEFKKAKEELSIIRHKVNQKKVELQSYRKSQKNAEPFLKRCQIAYDIILRRLQNNIVQGTFRRK